MKLDPWLILYIKIGVCIWWVSDLHTETMLHCLFLHFYKRNFLSYFILIFARENTTYTSLNLSVIFCINFSLLFVVHQYCYYIATPMWEKYFLVILFIVYGFVRLSRVRYLDFIFLISLSVECQLTPNKFVFVFNFYLCFCLNLYLHYL